MSIMSKLLCIICKTYAYLTLKFIFCVSSCCRTVSCWKGCDCQLAQEIRGHPLSCPWIACSAHHSYNGIHFKDSALREQYVVGQYMGLVPSKGLYVNFEIHAGGCENLLVSWLTKTRLICKSLYLLNLPPTNLERCATFFDLFLPHNGKKFQISCIILLSLWTNNWWASQETEVNASFRESHGGIWGIQCWPWLLCEEGQIIRYMLWHYMSPHVGLPKIPASLILPFEDLCIVHCDQKREPNTCHGGPASTVGSLVSNWCPTRVWSSS